MTVTTPAPPAPPSPVADALERRRAFIWTAVAIAGIWLAVAMISIFAPDNVSGAEHEHVPLAAILTWIWGVIASRNVLTAMVRRRRSAGIAGDARLLALAVVPIWAAATLVAVFAPVLVTGTDPTRFPIAAVVAPIAAMILTQMTTQLLLAFNGESGDKPDHD